MRNAANWWRRVVFERQLLYARKRRFVGWHNLEMVTIPPIELDLVYQTVECLKVRNKIFCALGIPAPVVFSYIMDKAQSVNGL